MKYLTKLTILLIILVLATSCAAPTPEIREVEVEVPVEQTVEVEVEVEKIVVATPVPELSILRFGIGYADLRTMDPHFASSTCDRALVDMIFNGLLRYKPGDGTAFEPDLAEAIPEPEMVDGTQVWTFKLRKGVVDIPHI